MPAMAWRKLILLPAIGLLAACSEPVSQSAAIPEAATPAADITVQLAARSGEMVYQHVCMACHATGVNEAPKFGDRAAWAELIEEGYGILVYESIKGEDMMPPRGGDISVTDLEMANAVAYMANAAGADFVAQATEQDVQLMLQKAGQEIHEHEDEKTH